MSPARERLLRRVTPVLLVAGVLLMVVFDRTLTLLAGVVLMLAFVVCGTFLIAAPGFLDGDELDGEDVARGATGEDEPGDPGGDDRSGGAPGGAPTAGPRGDAEPAGGAAGS